MADKRAFAVFDVGYLDNPKIMDVFDASPIAVCMHFASVLYCAQHLTDGQIALRAMQRKVGGSQNDVDLLVDAGLWHLPGHECPHCPEVADGKAYVHDYTEHNRTSEGVKGRSDAARKGAAALWEKKRNAAKGNANRMQTASEPQSESLEIAMPRQTDRQTEIKTPSTPPAASLEFDRFWKDYPRKIGKGTAAKAFKAARKRAEFQTIMDGLETLRIEVAGKDQQFIPHPTSWLNADRWADEVTKPVLRAVPQQYGWANQ